MLVLLERTKQHIMNTRYTLSYSYQMSQGQVLITKIYHTSEHDTTGLAIS